MVEKAPEASRDGTPGAINSYSPIRGWLVGRDVPYWRVAFPLDGLKEGIKIRKNITRIFQFHILDHNSVLGMFDYFRVISTKFYAAVACTGNRSNHTNAQQ